MHGIIKDYALYTLGKYFEDESICELDMKLTIILDKLRELIFIQRLDWVVLIHLILTI